MTSRPAVPSLTAFAGIHWFWWLFWLIVFWPALLIVWAEEAQDSRVLS